MKSIFESFLLITLVGVRLTQNTCTIHGSRTFNTDHHVKGLIPILDSMTYHEEVEHLWPKRLLKTPSLFLLFSEGSFYVLWCWFDEYPTLYKAGKCLKEVYVGLKNYWYYESCEDGLWLPEVTTDEMDPAGRFLHYRISSDGCCELLDLYD